MAVEIREGDLADLTAIARIYNEGIEDRIATLETEEKSEAHVAAWLFAQPLERHPIIVAVDDGQIIGWAALRPYSHRCAHAGIADLSIYVARTKRGQGVGRMLLAAVEDRAAGAGFHKIVLFALARNQAGRALYTRRGFREVGVFRQHGTLDGQSVDVLIMEKLL